MQLGALREMPLVTSRMSLLYKEMMKYCLKERREESNPEGIWQRPKSTATSLENKTTTSEHNPFAETMVWGYSKK